MEAITSIDYKFRFEDNQMVELELEHGGYVFGVSEGIVHMEHGFKVASIKGGDHALSGVGYSFLPTVMEEDLHISRFFNASSVSKKIIFSLPNHGRIIPIDLANTYKGIYCLSQAFLCAIGSSVKLSELSKNEFLCEGCQPCKMDKINGKGVVFIGSAGNAVSRHLEEDEVLRIDVGLLLAMTQEVQYDYQVVGNSADDSSVCMATLLGPGEVWLQSTSVINK